MGLLMMRVCILLLMVTLAACAPSTAPTLAPTVPAANPTTLPNPSPASGAEPLPFDEVTTTEYLVQDADLQRGTLRIPLGQRFTFRLAQNVSTGYVWEVTEQDTTFVQVVVDTVELADEGAVGSGGTRILSFQAVAAGSTRLVLKHWRPWEGEAGTLETITLSVEILPAADGE
jgi:predicted secreted protein